MTYIFHYSGSTVLEEGVQQHKQLVSSWVACYEDEFRQAMGAQKKAQPQKELAGKHKEL